MQNCKSELLKKADDQQQDPSQDPQQQEDQQQDQQQPQADDFQTQITQVITDLAKQINNLKYELSSMKSVVMTKSVVDNPDLNTTVLGNNNMMKKQAFLSIMDELNDVADAFIHTQPHISNRIDNIMDTLRFYDKV